MRQHIRLIIGFDKHDTKIWEKSTIIQSAIKQTENRLNFPNCTEIYEECKDRKEPCLTCPYINKWKAKIKNRNKKREGGIENQI